MQVLIILTDDKTYLQSLENGGTKVRKQLAKVKAKEVKVITVGVGPNVDLLQLKNIDDGADALHFGILHFGENDSGEKESFKFDGKSLLHSKCPKKYTKFFLKPCELVYT